MRSLISNNNGGFTRKPLIELVKNKQCFIFNLIRHDSIYRCIRIGVVESLVRLENENIEKSLELQLQSRVKWEELSITDTTILSDTYFDIPHTVDTLKTWIAGTKIDLIGDITIQLTPHEALMYIKNVFKTVCNTDIDSTYSDKEMVIIRNEYKVSEPYKYTPPIAEEYVKYFVTGYDNLKKARISIGCQSEKEAYRKLQIMANYPQFEGLGVEK